MKTIPVALGLGVLLIVGRTQVARADGGQTLPDLASVDAVLGSAAQTENFQKFNAAPNTGYGVGNFLDSNTLVFNQTGVVNPGLTFSVINGGGMQWNGVYALGNPVEDLSFNLNDPPSTAVIGFAQPTPAVGLDLIDEARTTGSYDVALYGADGTTLLAVETVPLDGFTPVFFGFEDFSGIGSITLTMSNAGVGPVGTDLLTYSTVLPEPGGGEVIIAAAAVAVLCCRKRRVTRARFGS
jgi:hypothetical protein